MVGFRLEDTRDFSRDTQHHDQRNVLFPRIHVKHIAWESCGLTSYKEFALVLGLV